MIELLVVIAIVDIITGLILTHLPIKEPEKTGVVYNSERFISQYCQEQVRKYYNFNDRDIVYSSTVITPDGYDCYGGGIHLKKLEPIKN